MSLPLRNKKTLSVEDDQFVNDSQTEAALRALSQTGLFSKKSVKPLDIDKTIQCVDCNKP